MVGRDLPGRHRYGNSSGAQGFDKQKDFCTLLLGGHIYLTCCCCWQLKLCSCKVWPDIGRRQIEDIYNQMVQGSCKLPKPAPFDKHAVQLLLVNLLKDCIRGCSKLRCILALASPASVMQGCVMN